jgi:hypothetical protein
LATPARKDDKQRRRCIELKPEYQKNHKGANYLEINAIFIVRHC